MKQEELKIIEECLLLKADTHIATFHEEAWCTPSRAFIGATSN